MNVQTERLENHIARLTVTLEAADLENAKQEAARQISRRVNVPGFRKGKVPYRQLVRFVGEDYIEEGAFEILADKHYKDALKEGGVDPYGAGSFESFNSQPQPTLVFSVALQPTVALGDYHSVRVEYTAPVVEDTQVDRAMRQLRERQAVIEKSHRPVELGNRVNMELYAQIIEEGAPAAEAKPETSDVPAVSEPQAEAHSEAADEAAHDHEHQHDHDHGLGENEFIHEHDAQLMLDDESEEPAPGFKQALVGANVNDERTFELAYPDDPEKYEDLAGKRARFKAKIKQIEAVTLPLLNDDFAARVTSNEEKPLTLLELRMRLRENLQKSLEREAEAEFADKALDKITETATVSYPQLMVDENLEDYLKDLDRDMRRNGLTLEDYIRVTKTDRATLKENYRKVSEANLRRVLVLRELITSEKIEVTDAQVDEHIQQLADKLGEKGQETRAAFDTPVMRARLKDELLQDNVMKRVIAIAKGEAPALAAVAEVPPTSNPEVAEGETK